MPAKTTRNPWMPRGLACCLALLTLGGIPALAEQTVKDPDDPVSVTLKTAIDGQTAQAGQPFEAELAEPLRYKQWTLPAGIRFTGRISKANHSRIFNRPGYVALRTEEAVLPGGGTFSFSGDKYEPRSNKVTGNDSRTFGRSVAEQAPFTAAGLGATIPLRATETVTNGSLVAIGLGVRMAAGAVVGPFRKTGDYENKPVAYKVARGALDGSGIPSVVHFLAVRDPEVSLASGDTVRLRFDPDALEALFKQAGSTQPSQLP